MLKSSQASARQGKKGTSDEWHTVSACSEAYKCKARFAGNGRSPWQEVQRRNCALQSAPFGAYRLLRTLRCQFSTGGRMPSNCRLDCVTACRPETIFHSSEVPLAKKRSLHVVNEHFEPDFNAVSCRLRVFQQPARVSLPSHHLHSEGSGRFVWLRPPVRRPAPPPDPMKCCSAARSVDSVGGADC